ncbi:MAG: terpene cyclase/mutase family protein [Phycisphaeraceae bacterium]|nr:terpene cyclase/mutase family protein [Phycisphaeraceae bacterium]MCB9847101.1 terpene cyclase/mutase family protein [Phycisphaeraceae bacterium]
MRSALLIGASSVLLSALAPRALAIDEAHYERALTMVDRATAYLRSQQDLATGGWAVNPQGPQFPAITGLVVTGMLMSPQIGAGDPAVAGGLEFILKYAQPDGGIYDRVLASYNTSICLSALSRAKEPDAVAALGPGVAFLRSLQWSEAAGEHPEARVVQSSDPFYGGVGYGSHSRPDLSNLQYMLQALHDAGVPGDDPAFQRAVVFLQRTQMDDEINDQAYADGSSQGGFIYSTGPEEAQAGEGESKAPMIWETTDDGQRVSRLRCYGTMTYAGFKSYLYADLDRDDERVRLAYDWIRSNYTLAENPGLGTEGQYYFYMVFGKALRAWGLPMIEVVGADGSTQTRDWANDLIDQLATLQNEDGSFKSVNKRWMEDNQTLITAYALIGLQNALGRE